MPIRDLEWFGGTLPHLHVHSNRGANGIDGVIATAIGVATATKKPTGLLIGDVAFVHDSSSLAGLAARGVDLRVMIVDNDGGGIFHFLPQASAIDEPTFELLFGTPHRTDLAALAGSHGVEVSVITDVNSVANFASNRGPCVAVARTDRRSDVELHRSIQRLVGEALASSPNQR
jgi:2-succinyl-5-enolpyruvyl-6-hydroxy-3-cyclohexene-1-carboxylate synthase